jgi:hypothetical protein
MFYCLETCTSLKSPASTVIGAIVEPVPSLEMGRVASGRASGVKFLPQHSSFEYQWIIWDDVGQSGMVF